jgi:Zn-dependent M28 family amino/carboxypeptidase
VPDPTPAESIFVRSDQYAFVRAGIPALYIDNADRAVDSSVDGPGLVRQFMRERYHQPSDDLAQPIHYPTLARLARINVRMGRDIANARGRPLWNRDNFFGRQYGPERMQR